MVAFVFWTAKFLLVVTLHSSLRSCALVENHAGQKGHGRLAGHSLTSKQSVITVYTFFFASFPILTMSLFLIHISNAAVGRQSSSNTAGEGFRRCIEVYSLFG